MTENTAPTSGPRISPAPSPLCSWASRGARIAQSVTPASASSPLTGPRANSTRKNSGKAIHTKAEETSAAAIQARVRTSTQPREGSSGSLPALRGAQRRRSARREPIA